LNEDPARPSVTVKYAQTLDGRIATAAGESRWISSAESRRLAHRLRALHDAVLVGVGTVIADNPQLTVRLAEGSDPLRVVVDSRLRTPRSAHVLNDHPERTVFAVTTHAPTRRLAAVHRTGAATMVVREDDGHVDLLDLLMILGARGVGSVLVEGGASIISSLLRQRLVGRLVVITAPRILGAGVEAVGDLDLTSLSEALSFADVRVEMLGPDMVVDGSIRYSASV
jgi:riboflavin-specific deaminase-like protein